MAMLARDSEQVRQDAAQLALFTAPRDRLNSAAGAGNISVMLHRRVGSLKGIFLGFETHRLSGDDS